MEIVLVLQYFDLRDALLFINFDGHYANLTQNFGVVITDSK